MSYTPYTGSTGDQTGREEPPVRRSSLGLIVTGVIAVGLLLALILWVMLGRRTSIIETGLVSPTSGLPTVAVPVEAPKVGSLAPDFELEDVHTGQTVKLSSFRGKPVWINFWATWCPPCKEEMPIMEGIYNENRDKGLVILGVDVQEQKIAVLPYIEKGSFTWTFVLDKNGKTADIYRVNGLPSHYFIDKDGMIQAIVIGGLKSEATGQMTDVGPYLKKIMP